MTPDSRFSIPIPRIIYRINPQCKHKQKNLKSMSCFKFHPTTQYSTTFIRMRIFFAVSFFVSRRSVWCRRDSERTTFIVSRRQTVSFCLVRGAGRERRAFTFRRTNISTTLSWRPFCSIASSWPWLRPSRKPSEYTVHI